MIRTTGMPASCAARTYSSTRSATSRGWNVCRSIVSVSSMRSPGPVRAVRNERDDLRAQGGWHPAIEQRGDLVRRVQLRDVHHHDRFVVKLLGALDDLVEVNVAPGTGGVERLLVVEERALHHQHARVV